MIYILSKDKKENNLIIEYSTNYTDLKYYATLAYCAVYHIKEVECIIID